MKSRSLLEAHQNRNDTRKTNEEKIHISREADTGISVQSSCREHQP